MKKYICLRDDDTSFFTAPGELADCYGEFWGKVPITLATIPFVHGSVKQILNVSNQENKYISLRDWEIGASAKELNEYHNIAPIGLNKELVNELKELVLNNKIEIAQHGVNHRYTEFGEEMLNKSITFAAIRDGKEYLNKLFEQKINVFVPPSNTIDNICADYLKVLGMNLLSCGSVVYTNRVTKFMKAVQNPRSSFDALKTRGVYPAKPIRSRGGYMIVGSITYNADKDRKEIYDLVKKTISEYGFASIATHYWMLSDKNGYGNRHNYRKNYLDLIKQLLDEDCVFLRASDYIGKAMEQIL